MKTAAELRDEANALQKQAEALHAEAHKRHQSELSAKPLLERMIFAAYVRCPCGAGMAYDPAGESGGLRGYWDCSAILLGAADASVKHEARLPFTFYEVKSERQPSANGATTRPALINGGLSQCEAFINPSPHSDMKVMPG